MPAELIQLLRPSPFFRVYTGAQVLASESGAPAASCRRIRATTAGTVTVKDLSGATVALVFLNGETQEVAATEIVSLASTTAVTVYW